MSDVDASAIAEDEALNLEQSADGDAPEVELDEDGNPIEADDDELEDVEFDGRKGKVSKSLKDGYLRHADYTQKTQAVAAERAEVEAGKTMLVQQATAHRAMLAEAAKVVSINQQLADYEKVTPEQWMAAHTQDPDATAQARMRMQLLKEERDRAVAGLQSKERERLQLEQRDTAKRVEQRDAVLARDIKGWSKDSLAKLAESAKEFGFTADEVKNTLDPRALKVLARAVANAKPQTAAAKVQNLERAQATAPAPKVASAGAPKTGLRDDLSSDEWFRRREAQRAAKRR